MEHVGRTVLLVALPLLCAYCAGTTPSPTLTGQAAPTAREGYVDAEGGVRLFYRMVGTGHDTVVVLDGGPGFSMSYWRPELRAVTAPALVIHGMLDFIPLESSREWAVAVPNGRLLLLEGSGHFPYLEVPERFFAAAEAFLQGRWPPGAEAASRPGRR
jgi:alpha-beta hydrolase superfamily lysophospholipase